MTPRCPVCHNPSPEHFLSVKGRDYWRCNICEARFLDPSHYVSAQTEQAEYELHQNDVDDPGYLKFLAKLTNPLTEKLSPGMSGLDYGCGPGPALAGLLQKAGHEVALFDPFFYPDPAPLGQTYDFITCTEVIEHSHNPAQEFDRLNGLLRPGGYLGLMTCFQTDDARFANWHYRNDPTHVVFYREITLHWIAKQQGWTCHIPVKDVAIMGKG